MPSPMPVAPAPLDLSWLPSFVAGAVLTVSHAVAHLAGLVRPNPFAPRIILKGCDPMDFAQARAIGFQVGQEAAKTVGAFLGLVEGFMPGADATTRHTALADLVSKQLANVETKVETALNVPADVAAEITAITTNPATLATLIGWFEQQAGTATTAPAAEATVPAAETTPAADTPAA